MGSDSITIVGEILGLWDALSSSSWSMGSDWITIVGDMLGTFESRVDGTKGAEVEIKDGAPDGAKVGSEESSTAGTITVGVSLGTELNGTTLGG